MTRPALAMFATSVLLWAIAAQANHYLADAHVYLFLGGLMITRGALALPLGSGMAASLLAGCVCDANALVPFGTHALLFAAAHAVLFNLRDRLPHDETAGRVVIALFVNFALFMALSFIEIGRSPAPAAGWIRLFADLLVSQVVLAIAAPWFLALQDRAAELARPAPAWR